MVRDLLAVSGTARLAVIQATHYKNYYQFVTVKPRTFGLFRKTGNPSTAACLCLNSKTNKQTNKK